MQRTKMVIKPVIYSSSLREITTQISIHFPSLVFVFNIDLLNHLYESSWRSLEKWLWKFQDRYVMNVCIMRLTKCNPPWKFQWFWCIGCIYVHFGISKYESCLQFTHDCVCSDQLLTVFFGFFQAETLLKYLREPRQEASTSSA